MRFPLEPEQHRRSGQNPEAQSLRQTSHRCSDGATCPHLRTPRSALDTHRWTTEYSLAEQLHGCHDSLFHFPHTLRSTAPDFRRNEKGESKTQKVLTNRKSLIKHDFLFSFHWGRSYSNPEAGGSLRFGDGGPECPETVTGGCGLRWHTHDCV